MAEKKYPREWTKADVPGVVSGKIIYEKKYFDQGGVARITMFNYARRPDGSVVEGMNVISGDMGPEMNSCMKDANLDPSIGVVVLTSKGTRAFLAGGDVSAEEAGMLVRPYEFGTLDDHLQVHMRKPIIVVVKGYAIASGNHMAYRCDLTIAAENAMFGQTGPMIGSPVDGYMVSYSTRVLGAKKAREMWMLCRRYNAQQALEMGLVNAVVPLDKLDEEVERWCQEILALSPTCISIVKAALDSDWEYMRESGRQQNLIAPNFHRGPESHEAQRAFMEKRQPEWWRFRGMTPPSER